MAEKKPLDKSKITLNIAAAVVIVGFIFTVTWGISNKFTKMESQLDYLIESDKKNTEDHKVFYKYQNDTNLTLLSIDMRLMSIEDSNNVNSALLLKIHEELKELNK